MKRATRRVLFLLLLGIGILGTSGGVAILSGASKRTVRRTLLYTSSAAAMIIGGAWLLG